MFTVGLDARSADGGMRYMVPENRTAFGGFGRRLGYPGPLGCRRLPLPPEMVPAAVPEENAHAAIDWRGRNVGVRIISVTRVGLRSRVRV